MTTAEHHLRDEAPRADAPQQPQASKAAPEQSLASGGAASVWRDADERLRLAVDAGSIGTWDFDPASGNLEWSDRSKALFGLSADAQPTIAMFLASLHPDDRPAVERKIAAALDPAGDGSYEAEFRVNRGDGSLGWLVCRGRALFTNDGGTRIATRLIGTAVDITDRRRSEDYSRLLAEASTLLASSLDLEVMLAGIGRLACQRFAARW